MTELSKGFTCTCGEYHKFPGYVYAHWHEYLFFHCSNCLKRWSLCRGIVEEAEDDDG